MPDSPTRSVTSPCPVKLRLSDGSTAEGILYLLPDSGRPSGFTTVEQILDSTREFLALGLAKGGNALVSRSAIRTVELAADGPGVPDLLDTFAAFDVITLHLDSGEEIAGVLRSVAPKGFERMSDVLNALGRFVALGVGDRIVLVARNRVVRVSF